VREVKENLPAFPVAGRSVNGLASLPPLLIGSNAKQSENQYARYARAYVCGSNVTGGELFYRLPALESRAPVVREGGYGTRKVVDGVDIWTTGEPPRKYQVLGIINDKRLQAPFEMARYYHDVAAKVKKAGGNGAIEAYSNSQITGIVSNSSTTSSGSVSA
jgi:hypothetical protein